MNTSRELHARTRSRRFGRSWLGVTAVVAAVGALLAVQAVDAQGPGAQPANNGGEASASLTTGAVFHAISPYRAYDSRKAGGCKESGFLPTGDVRLIDVATDDKCDLKITDEKVVAVSYNLTVDQTLIGGFLALYPSGGTWGGTAAVNWSSSSATVGNGGIIEVGKAFDDFIGFVNVEAGGPAGSGAHFIFDVTGYFATP